MTSRGGSYRHSSSEQQVHNILLARQGKAARELSICHRPPLKDVPDSIITFPPPARHLFEIVTSDCRSNDHNISPDGLNKVTNIFGSVRKTFFRNKPIFRGEVINFRKVKCGNTAFLPSRNICKSDDMLVYPLLK